jgi:hypothetical protein
MSINNNQHNITLHYAEFCYAQCRDHLIAMLSVVMLNVIMLSVVMECPGATQEACTVKLFTAVINYELK